MEKLNDQLLADPSQLLSSSRYIYRDENIEGVEIHIYPKYSNIRTISQLRDTLSSIIDNLNKIKNNNDKCINCKKETGTKELHKCPYQCDINGDYDYECNCCDECEQRCIRDI